MNMSKSLGVGIIGCGVISSTYLELSPMFKGFEVLACADVDPRAAETRAREFDIKAQGIEALLGNPDIDIVVNLTVPEAHFAVSKSILEAKKHVYSEKPLAVSLGEGVELKKLAGAAGLRIGCAPDTFLGGSHQQARQYIDQGLAGRITSGTCHVMSHGMEHWHPNPDFFFEPGGGPVLDLGPYYIAALVNLIGPVKRVGALSSMATPTRTITNGPRSGEIIPVSTPTTIHALLEFESAASITFSASWDVWAHRHAEIELYGTQGSIYVPDPNFFGGEVLTAGRDRKEATLAPSGHPFGLANQKHGETELANYRAVGLADMVAAIAQGREHRCSLERALHSVDVMTSILRSGEEGRFIDISAPCTRPEALEASEAAGLLR